MKGLYKNDDVYAVSHTCNTIGEALDYVKSEWPSNSLSIHINGNKISVIFDDQYEDHPVTLATYELRNS